VIAVASNKGGVGKTTVATNLAIYLRALHEDLPVLLLGLDDQCVIDRMFELGAGDAGGNLKHAWAERSLDRVVRLGQYGISYVPTPPDVEGLKSRARDAGTLRAILDASACQGVVIIDTKSDLEELTRNALAAADLVILPVADHASFAEARKAFRWPRPLRPAGRGSGRGGLASLPESSLPEPTGRGAELGHAPARLDPPRGARDRGVPAASGARRRGVEASGPRFWPRGALTPARPPACAGSPRLQAHGWLEGCSPARAAQTLGRRSGRDIGRSRSRDAVGSSQPTSLPAFRRP
jgi:hypothetical protein